MKLRFSGRWVVLILLVVGGGWVAWWSRPQPLSVKTYTVQTGMVESTVANTRAGSVEACQRTRLSTTQGGRIETLLVREGDRVKPGQLLMKLWNDDQQAQTHLAETQRRSAEKRVVEACALARNAEVEAGRQAVLRQRGFVSGSREDAARTEAEVRQAACESARSDVVQSAARVQVTQVEQRRTHLVAPFAGTVAKIVGEVGEYSTPSPPGVPTPPAIDLIDDSCLYIKAPMDEVDAPRLKSGQKVRISLDALPGQTFAGQVKRIAPYITAVEKQARTVEIDAVFDTLPAGMLVGYSADVEVLLDQRPQVVRIPTAAIQEGNKVMLLVEGRLQSRLIKAGLSNWEYTEVLEGVSVGDRIVTSLEREGVKPGVPAQAEAEAELTPEAKKEVKTQATSSGSAR